MRLVSVNGGFLRAQLPFSVQQSLYKPSVYQREKGSVKVRKGCSLVRGFRRPQPKQVLPVLLRLRPFQNSLRLLAWRGFRQTRAEHWPCVGVPAKRKAHHGLNTRPGMATRACHERRTGPPTHVLIVECIET